MTEKRGCGRIHTYDPEFHPSYFRASSFLGGLLAFVAGPQAVMVSAAVLFLLASLPLFKTAEPIEVGHRLSFKDFPWKGARNAVTAELAVGFDAVASGTVWSIFVAIAVLGIGATNEVYAELGILVSVALFAALAVSYVFGKVVDSRRGGQLLMAGVIANSVVHLFRPFTGSSIDAAAVNVANETATTGYMMPYIRGLFDTADTLGKRVTFLGITEVALNLGCTIAALIALVFATTMGEIEGTRQFFFIAAIAGLGILLSRFRLYKK